MERRVDPDDNVARTLEEMKQRYAGVYNSREIEAYFLGDCLPAGPPTAAAPAARQVGPPAAAAPAVRQAAAAPARPGARPAAGGKKIEGLLEWLQERDLEQYFDHVAAWCRETGAISTEEIEDNFEELKASILASEIEPGDRVRVTVLQGKWKGQYVAEVLGSNETGVRLRHEEDDFVETLDWCTLGGNKYSMEPVSDDSDEEGGTAAATAKDLLRIGRLRVDRAEGAGLELRWVKMGYCVDSVEARPGQQGLSAGDAIVAIGGVVLAGLSEDEVERHFGAALADGAPFVAGALQALMRRPVDEVRREADAMAAAC